MCVKTNLALVDTITLFRFEPRGAGRAVNKAMMLQSDTRAGQGYWLYQQLPAVEAERTSLAGYVQQQTEAELKFWILKLKID